MDMRKRVREQCELAQTYAEDGAYYGASRVLYDLALEVSRHAAFTRAVDVLVVLTDLDIASAAHRIASEIEEGTLKLVTTDHGTEYRRTA